MALSQKNKYFCNDVEPYAVTLCVAAKANVTLHLATWPVFFTYTVDHQLLAAKELYSFSVAIIER